MNRRKIARAAGALLISMALLPWMGAGAATAADPTVTVDIGAGSTAQKVGTATFTLSSTTLTIDSTIDAGVALTESHACVDDASFTERIPPGQCQFKQTTPPVTGDFVIALADVVPPLTGTTVCAQVHYVVDTNGDGEGGGETAYAGHQGSDEAFFGNVCLERPAPTQPSGSFTTECTQTGAQADIGTLSEGSFTGGSFKLVSGTFAATVTSGQQNVPVPASATIELFYDPAEGADKLLDTEASPAACAQVVTQPSGSFTVECIPAGAQADVGTLSEGTFAGGSFRLVSGSTSTVVTSGLQNVSVPGSSTIQLVYDPAQGADVVLDTKVSPAACPVVTTVTPVVEDTAVEDVKIENDEAEADDEVAVEGVKTEATDVLAATGSGLSLVGVVGLSFALLLAGAALIVAPRHLAFAKGQHRKG